jgi:hypothetical protein
MLDYAPPLIHRVIMIPPPQTQVQSQTDDTKAASRIIGGETVVGYAVLGCLAAGTIGLVKAIFMDGIGAGWCLLVSVAAFGTVCYIYYRKR